MFITDENDYTQQQFDEIYPKVKETVTAGITPEDRKCTIILGGQPGARLCGHKRRRIQKIPPRNKEYFIF